MMLPKVMVARETAAAAMAFASGVHLRSHRAWSSWSPSPPWSRTCVLTLVLFISCSLPVLQRIGYVPTLWCFGAGSQPGLLENVPSSNPVPPMEQSGDGVLAAAGGALAKLASVASAALRRTGVTSPLLGKSQGAARVVPASLVDASNWHESIIFDDGQDARRESDWEASSPLAAGAVNKFTQALNYVLNSAKQGMLSSEGAPTWSTAQGLPNSSMGWSLSEEPDADDTQSEISLQKNTRLSERPTWLLPDHRSPLTRMSVPLRESDTCPAVGGFGHPLGRRYEELEDWDGLLCRSGGMLRKANTSVFAYDMFVLVKGYYGGYNSLEDDLSSGGGGPSSLRYSLNIDDVSGMNGSGRRSEEFRNFLDISNSGRTWRSTAGTSREGQRKCRGPSKACDNENSLWRRHKTKAQLEDELNEVIDTLNMLYCRLANVVDLRHPSNYQLYALIRKVALQRVSVLQGRNQLTLRLPREQGVSNDPKMQQQDWGHNGDVSDIHRFATENDYAGGSARDESGVMRGQYSTVLSKYERTSHSPRRQSMIDAQFEKLTPHGAASGTSTLNGITSFHSGKKTSKAKLLKPSLYAPKGFNFEQRIHTPLLSSVKDEESSPPTEALEDDSGPVLVVVSSLTTPERLFFGAREIKEYLFSRLLRTAYEIRAYNEFKHNLFALARQKQSLSHAETAITNAKRGAFSHLYTSPAEDAIQEGNIAAFGHAGTASAGVAEEVAEKPEENTKGRKFITANPAKRMEREKRSSSTGSFSIKDWFRKRRDRASADSSDHKRLKLGVGQDVFDARPSEVPPTEAEQVSPGAASRESFVQQLGGAEPPEGTDLHAKVDEVDEEEPWWAPLGLRFDLYVSLSGVTAGSVTVSPTASLLRLVAEPRLRKLVCVYDYDDPKTDIPPVRLKTNPLCQRPAAVTRHAGTGCTGAKTCVVLC